MPRSTRCVQRELRIAVAAAGGRALLHVMDGNYLRASAVCFWRNVNIAARKTG
jgi:hypothetical protein